MTNSDNNKIFWIILAVSFTQIEGCETGGQRTSSWLSIPFRQGQTECGLSSLPGLGKLTYSTFRFRWVYCQLETLRRCFPTVIRRALDELPEALDETYERTLLGIEKEKREFAHRLFQCLTVAVRPLRVDELAEVLAIRFESGQLLRYHEDWRS